MLQLKLALENVKIIVTNRSQGILLGPAHTAAVRRHNEARVISLKLSVQYGHYPARPFRRDRKSL